MKYNGKLSISRYSNTNEFVIELVDDKSGVHLIEIELTAHDIAMAISGMGNVPCMFELRGADLIGKRREVKTEKVICDRVYKKSDEELRIIIKDYEVDGWVARISDLGNSHKYTNSDGVAGYNVVFTRFVEDV